MSNALSTLQSEADQKITSVRKELKSSKVRFLTNTIVIFSMFFYMGAIADRVSTLVLIILVVLITALIACGALAFYGALGTRAELARLELKRIEMHNPKNST